MKVLKLFFVLFLFTSMSLFPIIWCNRTEDAYSPHGDPAGTTGLSSKSSQTIRVMVINGACNFLRSHSDFQLLLQKVEKGDLYGPDIKKWLPVIINAIDSSSHAVRIYSKLVATAEAKPYNQKIIKKLWAFDYDKFSLAKGFHIEVYAIVREYLSQGDVTGAYRAIHYDMIDILRQLEALKKEMEIGVVPDISHFWQLNQTYSNSLFFGQYIAMIFKEL